jgi:hypothetical protein
MKFKVELSFDYDDAYELESVIGLILLGGTAIYSVKIPQGLIDRYPYGCDDIDEMEDFVKTEFANKLEELLSN